MNHPFDKTDKELNEEFKASQAKKEALKKDIELVMQRVGLKLEPKGYSNGNAIYVLDLDSMGNNMLEFILSRLKEIEEINEHNIR